MNASDRQPTRHHIIPSSRGGSDNAENIAMVKRGLHRKYHALFENKTPEEIIDYLVMYFWNGERDHIYNYIMDCREDVETLDKTNYFKTAS